MALVATALGVAAGLTLAFTLATNRPYDRHPDAVTLAWTMVGVWVVCTLADLLPAPHSKAINGPMDAVLGVFVLGLMIGHREWWKLPLLALLFVQGVMHFTYQANASEPSILWWYTLGLNATFVAQLLCIAWPGGRYVASLRDRHRSPRRVHPGTTPGLGGRPL